MELENWMPMDPEKGPPLPKWLNIYWPWYTSPEDLRVSNLVISPETVQINSPVTISCLVSNAGYETGTKTITCKVEGTVMGEQTITLAPGETQTVSFQVTPNTAKTYQVVVDGLTGSFNATGIPSGLSILLKNIPVDPVSGFPANKWQMLVFDQGATKSLNWGVNDHGNIEQPATFDIPGDWAWPLRLLIGIYYEWQENGEWYARQAYMVQSWSPNGNYKPIFITELGSYYYNVATESLEKV